MLSWCCSFVLSGGTAVPDALLPILYLLPQWWPDSGHQKDSDQDVLFVQNHQTGSQTSQVKGTCEHNYSCLLNTVWQKCFCRELDHPNLCKFVGGCVEVPNVAIVTEYCPKGSLNDVLLNEEIPLNWGFRSTHTHTHCVTHSVSQNK